MLISEVMDVPGTSDASASSVVLYRGIGNMRKDPVGTSKVQPIRTDRMLLHSSPLGGRVFDLIMEINGLPMRKANTVSVTQDIEQSSFYGGACRVYPMNGTQYLYSTKVADFITLSSNLLKAAYKVAIKHKVIEPVPGMYLSMDSCSTALQGHEDFVEKYVRAVGKKAFAVCDLRTTTNIDDVKASIGEILLYGTPKYIAVRVDDPPF